MGLVGEGGGWSLRKSGVGTKVRLEVGLNSRGDDVREDTSHPMTDLQHLDIIIGGLIGIARHI